MAVSKKSFIAAYIHAMSNLKLLLFFFLFITCASSWTTRKCSGPQKYALLLFKQSLSSINDTSYDYICRDSIGSGYYPILMNWNTSSDCCNWKGVTCNPFTGDVIGIDLSCGMLQGTIYLNTTLFRLPHLQRLNLAYNFLYGSQIPREIGKFSNILTHLNLSNTYFTGEIPSSFFFLSKLVSLDLSQNSLDYKKQRLYMSDIFQNFTSLEDLWLDGCGLDGYLPTHLNISSLISLDLGSNTLKGRLPDNIFDLQHLEKLDLSRNYEVTGPFPKVNRSISLPLKWLDLRAINLLGELPDSIGHFKSLNYLDLSTCGLVGSIPKSIVNLRHLTTLDLSYNYMLNGTVPSSFFSPSIEYIFLAHNMFSGVLPSEFFNCRSLKRLSLRNNQFSQAFTPLSFIQLNNLSELDISYNNFTGLLELDTLLSTLPKLEKLGLSYSGLSVVTTKANDYVNPDFIYLGLASCNLTVFPQPIRAMKTLQHLDLSDNEIRGCIPDWAGEIGGNALEDVDLSHNSITCLPTLKWYGLKSLFLQSNQIQEPFPPSICNMSNLEYLDMSSNKFGGVIPECFIYNIDALFMINLGTNHFSGTIPDVFEDCGGLWWLILNGNQLEGEVPSSLSKCQNLRIIDLGNNHLNGTFPRWLGDLPYLTVLVLKSNNLYGTIGTSSSVELPFTCLRVLDLSHNGFVGQFPAIYFQNFKAMKNVVKKSTQPEYFLVNGVYYSIIVSMKGVDQVFPKLFVDYRIVDLSNNKFEMEIPYIIGNLKSLVVLNLSHNRLTGRIPYALGKLSELESLDLSSNQLRGKIPQSLAGISALAVLNLSQNNLVGRIPPGKQFNTFDETSFGGNSGLCGFPLSKECEHANSPVVESNKDDDDNDDGMSGFGWKVVMLGYGCGTVIGFVLGYLMLSTGKPKWFNEISDAAEHMILKRRNIRR